MRRLLLAAVLVVLVAACGGAVTQVTTPPTPELTTRPTPEPTTRPTPEPATPAAPLEEPVVLKGSGEKNTKPFMLAGGDYTVTWSATSPSRVGCYHSAQLVLASDPSSGEDIGSALNKDDKTHSDETSLYGLEPGRYYVAASSGCDWTIAIAPLK